MTTKILRGDCRDILKTLPDASVDSIVTDPPYHLTTGKKGGTGPASASLSTPHGRARVTTGFMGMTWDGGDVAQDPAMWAECLRVLKPGGYLLAFSGTRTQHRMVCAIEDAGFEVRDQMGWMYGSGFPKSHNGEWGGTALKPAWEPICMARKTLVGTVEANWRKHGTGALNIDGCRVMFQNDDDRSSAKPGGKTTAASGNLAGKAQGGAERAEFQAEQGAGRWPANLLHDGSPEVLALFPQTESGKPSGVKAGNNNNIFGQFAGGIPVTGFGDAGSAARFFWCPKTTSTDRHDGLQHVEGKNSHPTVKPTELMRYLCRLVTPPGGVVLDPFMGSGSTLKAAELEGFSAIGIELDQAYIEIAKRRIGADAPLFAEAIA